MSKLLLKSDRLDLKMKPDSIKYSFFFFAKITQSHEATSNGTLINHFINKRDQDIAARYLSFRVIYSLPETLKKTLHSKVSCPLFQFSSQGPVAAGISPSPRYHLWKMQEIVVTLGWEVPRLSEGRGTLGRIKELHSYK